MFEYFEGNSLWHLIKQADWMSKGVLLTLFSMSVLCWTVFLCKLILLRIRQRDIHRAYHQLQAVRKLDDVIRISAHFSNSMPGRFLAQTLLIFSTLEEIQPDRSRRNWEILQYHIDQTVDTHITLQETYLPLLSTSAAVAPLLGLFGTVWGLVHAFISISEKQSADITVVAPGIAEALITTLAGLIVAIPALIMYNYLLNKVRKMEQQIINLADKVSFIMHQALLG